MGVPIYYAKTGDWYCLKMQGRIRFTDCAFFSDFQQILVQDPHWKGLCADLTALEYIDSTGLGILAGCAIVSQQLKKPQPVLWASHPDILQLLRNLQFGNAFAIRHAPDPQKGDPQWALLEHALWKPVFGEGTENEWEMARKVLKAHENLVQLDPANTQTFQGVLDAFTQEMAHPKKKNSD